MANSNSSDTRYDSLFKGFLSDATSKLLNWLAQDQISETLNTEFPEGYGFRVDGLFRLSDGGILHVEIQSTNDTAMEWRMLRYFLLIAERETQKFAWEPSIKQAMLYIGSDKVVMDDRIVLPALNFSFPLHDLSTFSQKHPKLVADLSSSECFDDKILALLCKSSVQDREWIATLKGIDQIPQRDDRLAAVKKLVIAMTLRRVPEPTKERIREMAIQIDVRSEPLFLNVFHDGEKKQVIEGIEDYFQSRNILPPDECWEVLSGLDLDMMIEVRKKIFADVQFEDALRIVQQGIQLS